MTNWIITFPSKGTDIHRFWFCYWLVKYERLFTNSIWFGASVSRWSVSPTRGWVVTAQGPWVPWVVATFISAVGLDGHFCLSFSHRLIQLGWLLVLLLFPPTGNVPFSAGCFSKAAHPSRPPADYWLHEASGATRPGRCRSAHPALLTFPWGPPAACIQAHVPVSPTRVFSRTLA